MTRDEFLFKLFTLYPMNFNENNMANWKSVYEQVLCENWDFKKLWWIFGRDYKYTNTAPAPAYFQQFKKDVTKQKTFELEVVDNSVPMPESFKELGEKLLEKVSMSKIPSRYRD